MDPITRPQPQHQMAVQGKWLGWCRNLAELPLHGSGDGGPGLSLASSKWKSVPENFPPSAPPLLCGFIGSGAEGALLSQDQVWGDMTTPGGPTGHQESPPTNPCPDLHSKTKSGRQSGQRPDSEGRKGCEPESRWGGSETGIPRDERDGETLRKRQRKMSEGWD